jgi:16S rRNA (cytidine1402-2'-O)-methyltransferase
MDQPVQSGTLYIVSTPIGNLEDISIRAVQILSGVDLIAAEDTRTTRILLDHYGIRKPLISYYSYNEARRTPELVSKLRSGSSIALVSDAGTPGISDPAVRVVLSALEAGIGVKAIPGPSALLPALIVSGLPVSPFVFEGFLPVKKGRRSKLERLGLEERTIVLYESPHRLLKTLRELREMLGDREISVARELTKKFEEVVRGSVTDVLEHFLHHPVRGEFVIVVAGAPQKTTSNTSEPAA